jgi:hypothetical protein
MPLMLALALLASPAAAHDETPADPELDCPRLCEVNGLQEWTFRQVINHQVDPSVSRGLIWSVWCECGVPAAQLKPGTVHQTRALRLRHATYVEEPGMVVALLAGVVTLAALARRRRPR